MEATLLVEVLTEELPPKSLVLLGEVFADEIANGLIRHQLKQGEPNWRWFATPRRLAVLIPGVLASAADRSTEVTGPPVKAPPEAVAGFARKQGVDVKDLKQRETPKGNVYLARVTLKGASLGNVLTSIVEEAIKKLPIPKVMRWGAGDAQFVRPVHGVVLLHGERAIPGTILGVAAGRETRGHRFMGSPSITLATADEYEARLLEDGCVVADFDKRRAEIERLLGAEAARQQSSLGDYQSLLDEVTALVEYPSVYAGTFNAQYLKVPPECLILTMRQNQKYFPLFDAYGRLLPKFLIVSNMQVDDPRHIISGNERVVRPRLEDARFFYDQDRKTRLETRVPQLAKVVYHAKLGSQLERVERIQLLAGHIARQLGADPAPAGRAAWLSKADLATGMVGEFPELQGTMGCYYALHDGEPKDVAEAIEAHYRPRFAGDRLPEGSTACAVALADKLDSLVGFFGIGQQPTGDKDPFGLRRAALGVVRIIVENSLPLALYDLITAAFVGYPPHKIGNNPLEVQAFILERFAGYLREKGYATLQVDSVLANSLVPLNSVLKRLDAVKAFQSLPEAESLAAANKRVANILRQAESKGESFANAAPAELKEPAERALHEAIQVTAKKANALFDQGDYAGYLKSFSVLKAPVDTFFDKVMVMVEDAKVRHGRLALLHDLREAMNRVADISRLAQ
jgi:glycyl-tRNA synthetase beta chain